MRNRARVSWVGRVSSPLDWSPGQPVRSIEAGRRLRRVPRRWTRRAAPPPSPSRPSYKITLSLSLSLSLFLSLSLPLCLSYTEYFSTPHWITSSTLRQIQNKNHHFLILLSDFSPMKQTSMSAKIIYNFKALFYEYWTTLHTPLPHLYWIFFDSPLKH